MAISYLDFIVENERFKNQTVVIAAQEIAKEDFESYMFTLRKLNIRVIEDDFVILDDEVIRHNTMKLSFHIFSNLM